MIGRIQTEHILKSLDYGKVIIIFGARQTGKTSLLGLIADNVGKKRVCFLNADERDIRELFLSSDNSVSLKSIVGNNDYLFIDEAQRIKDIGIKLKILSDNFKKLKIIATGSSSFDLGNKTQEALTGRKIEYKLFPFSFAELVSEYGLLDEKRQLEERLIFGNYPEIVLATSDKRLLLSNLAESYLYKDILALDGIRKQDKIERLLKALAFQIGSQVSFSELANIVGIDAKTVEKYIDILEKSFIIFTLPSFARNARNELKFSRKIYFYDNGIRNAVISRYDSLINRDDVGKLWENYLVSEKIKQSQNNADFSKFYFWRTKEQKEIDLIQEKDGQLKAFEFKYSQDKKVKIPLVFANNYPGATFEVIDKSNYQDFLI